MFRDAKKGGDGLWDRPRQSVSENPFALEIPGIILIKGNQVFRIHMAVIGIGRQGL